MRAIGLVGFLALGACAMATQPMEMADGSYSISARAAPARGGATGAYEVAHKDAMTFCQQSGKRAVLEGGSDRDIYQSGGGGYISPQGGGFGGSTMAAGSAMIRFRCV
jgi:hypothetical protein